MNLQLVDLMDNSTLSRVGSEASYAGGVALWIFLGLLVGFLCGGGAILVLQRIPLCCKDKRTVIFWVAMGCMIGTMCGTLVGAKKDGGNSFADSARLSVFLGGLIGLIIGSLVGGVVALNDYRLQKGKEKMDLVGVRVNTEASSDRLFIPN